MGELAIETRAETGRPIRLANDRGIAWVDAEDYETASHYNWRLLKRDGLSVHAIRNVRSSDGRRSTESLHRFVAERMGIGAAPEIDHEDRDGLNCRRSNLRAASHSQNQTNRGLQCNNTSGFKGVYRSKRGRWTARIKLARKYRNLGDFVTAVQAARVYNAWAKEAWGHFAVLNEIPDDPAPVTPEPTVDELCDIDDLPDCLIGGVHQPHCRHAGKPVTKGGNP